MSRLINVEATEERERFERQRLAEAHFTPVPRQTFEILFNIHCANEYDKNVFSVVNNQCYVNFKRLEKENNEK